MYLLPYTLMCVSKVTMCLAKSYWSSIPGMRDHMTSKVKELPLQAETSCMTKTITLKH